MRHWKGILTMLFMSCGGSDGGAEDGVESESEGESESEAGVCNPNDPDRELPWYTCQEQLLPSGFGANKAPTVGSTVPRIVSTDQSGNAFDLYDLYGDVVAFDICRSFSPSCVDYADQAEDRYQEYRSRGVVFLTVITDISASDWATMHGLTFPVVGDADGAIATAFDITAVPTFFVLDRELTITDTWVGKDTARLISAVE